MNRTKRVFLMAALGVTASLLAGTVISQSVLRRSGREKEMPQTRNDPATEIFAAYWAGKARAGGSHLKLWVNVASSSRGTPVNTAITDYDFGAGEVCRTDPEIGMGQPQCAIFDSKDPEIHDMACAVAEEESPGEDQRQFQAQFCLSHNIVNQ